MTRHIHAILLLSLPLFAGAPCCLAADAVGLEKYWQCMVNDNVAREGVAASALKLKCIESPAPAVVTKNRE